LLNSYIHFQAIKCIDNFEAEREKEHWVFKYKRKPKSSILRDCQWRRRSRYPDKWREEVRGHRCPEEAKAEDEQDSPASCKQQAKSRRLQNRTGNSFTH
jgi:hypothetical protein